MEMAATLIVFHKDIDLVARTAFLALTGKMGYQRTLMGLRRFDYFRFLLDLIPPGDREAAFDELEHALSLQSTFYNQNKHNYFLECSAGEWHRTGGFDLADIERRLAREAVSAVGTGKGKKLSGQTPSQEVMFNKDHIFLAEVLVEEIDPRALGVLGQKLDGSGGWRGVRFLNRGVLWWLVLRESSIARAERVVGEITVSEKRDRGLLLNPNYQRYDLLSLRHLAME
jgi:hypothetical protein